MTPARALTDAIAASGPDASVTLPRSTAVALASTINDLTAAPVSARQDTMGP